MKQISRSELLYRNAIQAERIKILAEALEHIKDATIENMPDWIEDRCYPCLCGYLKGIAERALIDATEVN